MSSDQSDSTTGYADTTGENSISSTSFDDESNDSTQEPADNGSSSQPSATEMTPTDAESATTADPIACTGDIFFSAFTHSFSLCSNFQSM